MEFSYRKLDESYSELTITPQDRNADLADLLRTFPQPLPATHTFEFRWEDQATTKRPNALPKLILGPRELTIQEIAERTKQFETLSLAELRWLAERHKVQPKPLVKGQKLQDDVTTLREGLRELLAGESSKTAAANAKTPDKKPVQGQGKDADKTGAVVLPPDIAAMSEAELETEAATLNVHEEYMQAHGKKATIAARRAWIAGKRAKQAEETVGAGKEE